MKLNYSINMLKILVLCALLGCTNLVFAQQTLSDFSVLPENLTGDISSNPNVMIILDTSSSMSRWNIANTSAFYLEDPVTGVRYRDFGAFNGSVTDASSSFSNSYQVRAAMLDILSDPIYQGRLNIGLMSFGQRPCNYSRAVNEAFGNRQNDEFFEFTGCNTIATNGLGLLKANIGILDGSHRDNLRSLLALEPTPWSAANTGYSTGDNRRLVVFPGGNESINSNTTGNETVNGLIHPFFDPDPNNRNIDGNETPILTVPDGRGSNGRLTGSATPLAGSLDTAFRYLFRNDTAVQNLTSLDSVYRRDIADREIGLPLLNGESQSVNYLSTNQCSAPITVILLTDGEPSQLAPTNIDNTSTGTTTNNGAEAAISASEEAAERIRFRGHPNAAAFQAAGFFPEDEVQVHVIAFNVLNAGAADRIAVAGGTSEVVQTDSTEGVRDAFAAIFDDTLTEGATRGGVAIVTAPDSAAGSFVQPSFTPLTQSATNDTEQVVWSGELRGFFVDRFGNLRENTISTGTGTERLDDGDKGFAISFDPDLLDVAFVETFDVDPDNGNATNISGTPDGTGGFAGGSFITVDDLNPIWSATDSLDSLVDTEALVAQNRPYSAVASSNNSGRYIFSWADANGDNIFTETELNDFSWSASPTAGKINPDNQGAFDLPAGANSDEDAEDLVNFIRGYQSLVNNPFRNRIIDGNKLLLGDIVHSTPVQIDGPALLSSFGTDELRENYTSFADFYADRRKVVYIGANDGMLHAFNGGFFDLNDDGSIDVESTINGATNHGLGDELWAFIPNAVLPQLKFLTDINYAADQHISFVDGSLQSFDVKIFDGEPGNCNVAVGATPAASCRYINGWGTILVGGLRLGGGDYTADFNDDGVDETKHSSFFILDVTDPESEPVLLDEITSPNLNFTISQPALVQTQSATPSATDRDYYLVLGSGPDDGETATNTSGSQASIFAYDLKTRGGILNEVVLTDSQANSFVGDMTSVDWNADDIDDAVYFGTVNGPVDAAGGQLFRTSLDASSLSSSLDAEVIFDVGLPIQHEPVVPADQQTQDLKYLLFGTGRTLSLNDTDVTFNPGNRFYGIQESFIDITSNPVVFGSAPIISDAELLDTTGFDTIQSSDEDLVDGTNTRGDILDAFEDGTYTGWVFDMPANTSRLAARPVTFEELVFFTDFQPQDPTIELDEDQCLPEGSSFVSIFDYRTGIVPSSNRFSPDGLGGEVAEVGEDGVMIDLANIEFLASQAGAALILEISDPDLDSTGGPDGPDGPDDPDDPEMRTRFKFLLPGSKQEIDSVNLELIDPVPSLPTTNFGRKSWREINLFN